MNNKLKVLFLVREVTSRLPRIRGLGIILALIASAFRRQNLPNIEVAVFGKKMLLDPNDMISNCLIFTPQWYDFNEMRFIKKILDKDDYVIDIGANIGAYSLMFAELVGSTGKVTAIEAEQQNVERLSHNIRINGIRCIDVTHAGVSDKEEVLTLLLNGEGNAGGHSFFKQINPKGMSKQEVRCLPLSEIIDSLKTPKLMKLDIEGFEWRVLRKFFEDVPSSQWPEFILLEDDPRHREGDAVSLALNHGYSVVNRFDYNVFMVR